MEENQFKKAKSIFNFIKSHYTWNGRYWNSDDEKVKEAFDLKTGTAGEINLSLYNSLAAAEIDANLVVLSTRDHGIPTKLFPVIFDFNYVIVKVTIDGKTYYLDATDKFLPFGQIPIRCLNERAREISFREESNWINLSPRIKSSKSTNMSVELDTNGNLIGKLHINTTGYFAADKREELLTKGKEKYLEEFESENPNI